MEYAHVRLDIPGPTTPVQTLAAASNVDSVHLLAGGVEDTDAPTYALSIEGEDTNEAVEESIRAVLDDNPDVLAWEIAAAESGSVYAYVRFHAPPIVRRIRERLTTGSLVVLLPATFRAGRSVEMTVVGSPSDLSSAFDELSDDVPVEVLRVGTYQRGQLHGGGRSLTERQREVLQTAYDLGYYEMPSRTSHEEIAAEIGCAASTVGEHLRKGEARLVAEALT